MKSEVDLLRMYKEEKELVIGPFHLRTGLEEFPKFKEWKLEYMRQYAETHDMDNPVTMEEAVAALEEELAADDDLLNEDDLAALAADSPETTTEDTSMTEETTAAPAENTPAPAKPKAAKKKAAPKAKATKRPPSKAKDAQKVFDRLYPKVVAGKKARKDVINELVTKVNLTPNGAATYYQKMKKAAG